MGKKVYVYITPDSPHTREIKDFLEAKGIEVVTYDITSSANARKKMIEATRGAGGPPVIEVGHQVVFGFDRKRLEETIRYEFG